MCYSLTFLEDVLCVKEDMVKLSIEQAQQQLSKLIEEIQNSQMNFTISSPAGNAVLMSEEAHQNLLITLEMLSTPIFLENCQD